MSTLLLCSVRGCRLPLHREERRHVCPKGHSFDISRSGYVNLLQPQDRRAKDPGDTAAARQGRRRIHERGITGPFISALSELLADLGSGTVLDVGCGEGFYLGALAEKSGWSGVGVDISIPSIDTAARNYPSCEWVVANADRFLPFADRSMSAILSITARINVPEMLRCLRSDGRVIVAVPAPDDVVEIRGTGKDRRERTIEAFSPFLRLSSQQRVTTAANLDAEALSDIRHAIYRPIAKDASSAMSVTFSLDILVFRPV